MNLLPWFTRRVKLRLVPPRPVSGDALPSDSYRVPADLAVSVDAAPSVLVVGSCLVEGWGAALTAMSPEATSDYVLLNNVSQLPERPPRDLDAYDFQIVQVPLRSVLPEGAYYRLDYANEAAYATLFEESLARLDQYFDAAMRWNHEHQLLTFVVNFLAPQQNPMGRLLPKYDLRNLAYFVARLNEELDRRVRACSNAFVLDVDEINATLGRRYFQDDTVWSGNHAAALSDIEAEADLDRLEKPQSISSLYALDVRSFIRAYWNEALAMWRTVRAVDSVKLVIVDLDDTLWRGVQAEGVRGIGHPMEGWPLGMVETLGHLKRRGVLLAIVSKNSLENVTRQWEELINDSRLQLADFAMVRVNWRPKAENIEDILNEINVLPKNVVFLDDNPVERHAVRSAFPDIRVFGPNPYLWRRMLLWSPETQVPVITSESAARTEMVKGQIERNQVKRKLSREEFLADLQLEMSFSLIADTSERGFDRALELINKTNQFNTTGKRWDVPQFHDHLAGGGKLATFEVQDRFTRYGVVGVIVLSGDTIEQFVMSCRVVGLDAEKMAIYAAVQFLRDHGATDVHAREIETAANLLSRTLYRDHGFLPSPRGVTLPASVTPDAPAHIGIRGEYPRIPAPVGSHASRG